MPDRSIAVTHGSQLERPDYLLQSSPLAAWLLAINILTCGAYAYDKWRAARGEYRVRESHLLTLALIGGTPGAILAMKLFRHKISKKAFRQRMRLIIWLQLAAAVLVLFLYNGWLRISIW